MTSRTTYTNRHRVKPGMTGWAQIHGYRGEIDHPKKWRKVATLII